MKQRRLTEKPGLAGAAAADHKDILVSGVLGQLGSARHGDTLRHGHGNILKEIRVDVGGDICRRTPPGAAILNAMPVFLCVLALVVNHQPQDHRTGYTNQQIRGMEAGGKRGKSGGKTGANG